MLRTVAAALAVAVALAAGAADAKILIAIDKSTQRMTVSVDGATRWTWPVSTGRRGRETPAGSFQSFRMERDHYSREWDDAPMPHSIFFTKRGHAIHGSHDTRRLGSPASAGCVRLHPDHARQLFELVEQRGVLTATVVITGVEPRVTAPPAVARQTPQPSAPPPLEARPVQPRIARQPQYEQYDIYGRPIGAPGSYREPGYPPPVYRRPQPGYEHLPPPPPGYMYAPQPAPPAGYYYYR